MRDISGLKLSLYGWMGIGKRRIFLADQQVYMVRHGRYPIVCYYVPFYKACPLNNR